MNENIEGEIAVKLIGKLADNVSKAKDPEEAKGIIRDAGMELSDEEIFLYLGICQTKWIYLPSMQ